jgi:ABC-2 type transport system ATP-binding protein
MMQDAPVVISLEALTRRFDEVVAVEELSFAVLRGEVFGFLGHNGAGKTTTIRLLNGVLAPSAGASRVLGFDPVNEGAALRRRTGVLTETPSLDERLTARENLRFYANLYDVPEESVSPRIDELLERFELADRAEEKVSGYSRGMKQRLALSRALLHKPELVFLDEPTAGLDPVAARQVRRLITHLSDREGRTIILCTHNLVEAQRLCDRVAVLEHGKLLALGTPSELGQRMSDRHRVAIEVSPDTLQVTLETLRRAPGISDVTVEDSVVTFKGADRERIPDIVILLARSGSRIYHVTPQEPSLEDVYFALHGERHSDVRGAREESP